MLKEFLLGMMLSVVLVVGSFGAAFFAVQQNAISNTLDFYIKGRPSWSDWYPGKLQIEGYMAVPVDTYLLYNNDGDYGWVYIDCFYSGMFEFGCLCDEPVTGIPSTFIPTLLAGQGAPSGYVGLIENSFEVDFPLNPNPSHFQMPLYDVYSTGLVKRFGELPSGNFLVYNSGRGAYEIRFRKTWKHVLVNAEYGDDSDYDDAKTMLKIELYDYTTNTWKTIYHKVFWQDSLPVQDSTDRRTITMLEVTDLPDNRLHNASDGVGFRGIQITYNRYPYSGSDTTITLNAGNSNPKPFDCDTYYGYCGLTFEDYWDISGNSNSANWLLRWLGPTQ